MVSGNMLVTWLIYQITSFMGFMRFGSSLALLKKQKIRNEYPHLFIRVPFVDGQAALRCDALAFRAFHLSQDNFHPIDHEHDKDPAGPLHLKFHSGQERTGTGEQR